MLAAVRDALDRLRAGLEPRSAFEPSRSTRVFNISARDAGAFMIAPALAGRLQAAAPGIRIAWSQVARSAISGELASGRLDLALDVPGVRGADLERERLMSTSYVCAVAKDHPMADKAVSLEQFAALRHVVVSSRREDRSYIEEVVRAAGYRITPVMRLPHYMPALEIVRQTDMVLTAPAALAAGPGLAALTLDAELPGLETDLYWRRENTEDPALSWLRGLLIRLSRSLPFPASA